MIIKKIVTKLADFFLLPASPRPLAALRIGLALVLIAQALMLRGSAMDFLAHDGIVQGELARTLTDPYAPKISTLVELLSKYGIGEASTIYSVCWAYLAGLFLMGIGLWTRSATVVAWFLHWVLTNSSATTSYGLDLYGHVFLFYLIWMPTADAFSVDALLRARGDLRGSRFGVERASTWARLSLRVLQLHLCIAYLFSGIDKAQGEQWWNGELLWRALTLPVYRQFDMSWLAHYPFLSKAGGWATLVFETGYCVFIWPKQTRKFWVAAIVGLHLGIAVFLGLSLFGIIMCVLTLCVFGVSSEPRGFSETTVDERTSGSGHSWKLSTLLSE